MISNGVELNRCSASLSTTCFLSLSSRSLTESRYTHTHALVQCRRYPGLTGPRPPCSTVELTSGVPKCDGDYKGLRLASTFAAAMCGIHPLCGQTWKVSDSLLARQMHNVYSEDRERTERERERASKPARCSKNCGKYCLRRRWVPFSQPRRGETSRGWDARSNRWKES